MPRTLATGQAATARSALLVPFSSSPEPPVHASCCPQSAGNDGGSGNPGPDVPKHPCVGTSSCVLGAGLSTSSVRTRSSRSRPCHGSCLQAACWVTILSMSSHTLRRVAASFCGGGVFARAITPGASTRTTHQAPVIRPRCQLVSARTSPASDATACFTEHRFAPSNAGVTPTHTPCAMHTPWTFAGPQRPRSPGPAGHAGMPGLPFSPADPGNENIAVHGA